MQEGETQCYAAGFNAMADQSKLLTFFVIKPAKCNVDKVTTGHVISGTLWSSWLQGAWEIWFVVFSREVSEYNQIRHITEPSIFLTPSWRSCSAGFYCSKCGRCKNKTVYKKGRERCIWVTFRVILYYSKDWAVCSVNGISGRKTSNGWHLSQREKKR